MEKRLSEKVQEKLERLRKTIPTQDAFAEALAHNGSLFRMAKAYNISEPFLRRYRIELFGDIFTSDILARGKILIIPAPRPVAERQLIRTLTFRVVDMEAFLAGGAGTYAGLELVKEEYIDEVARAMAKVEWGGISPNGNPRKERTPVNKFTCTVCGSVGYSSCEEAPCWDCGHTPADDADDMDDMDDMDQMIIFDIPLK